METDMKDSIWFVLPGTDELVSPYSIYDNSKRIEAAQKFSATMVTTVVGEDLDGFLRGNNDILILTKVSYGEQPLVDRIHFYDKEISTGDPIRSMFADNIFTTDDYSGNDKLRIELNVLEIDTDSEERKMLTSAFQSLSTSAGAVFPAILPYAFAASTTAEVMERLISTLEKDQYVIKFPLSLYPGELKRGMAPLQEGDYVVFSEPRDPIRFRLQPSGLLTLAGETAKVSYSVFNVSGQTYTSPSFILSQKIATLLTQINSGNSNSTRGTLNFLESTIQQYSNYQKLQRYLELKSKANPSEKETQLLGDIEKIKELKPFLPKT
jgi:hypothetical protein